MLKYQITNLLFVAEVQGKNRCYFYCPGCKDHHVVTTGTTNDWGFNNNLDCPTFDPSILVTGIIPITDEQVEIIMSGGKVEPTPFRCHIYIRNGKIEFLSDCSHALAGQTVELPSLPDKTIKMLVEMCER